LESPRDFTIVIRSDHQAPPHRAYHACLQPMPRGAEIPEAIRNQIVGMRRVGSTFATIGDILDVDPNTASKVFKRWEETGDCASAPRSGAPKKLTATDLRHVRRHIQHDRQARRQPLTEMITDLNLSISKWTLERAIKNDLGMGHRIERKAPWLSPAQKAKRLAFAKEHILWTEEEWSRVVFSDEMCMQTMPNSGRKYVWRYPEEEFIEDCCGATVIQGFEKVKIWGAMRVGKLSELVIIPEPEVGQGKMTARLYTDLIMDGEFYDFWLSSMEECGYVLMMEDGAPYHKGCATSRRKQLEEMGWIGWGPGTWPSNSPDLNPIEHLWYILKSQIRKRKVQPRNRKELIDVLQEEWRKIDMDKVRNLILSMPRRLEAVIKANGGTTGY
jgi:transposase